MEEREQAREGREENEGGVREPGTCGDLSSTWDPLRSCAEVPHDCLPGGLIGGGLLFFPSWAYLGL